MFINLGIEIHIFTPFTSPSRIRWLILEQVFGFRIFTGYDFLAVCIRPSPYNMRKITVRGLRAVFLGTYQPTNIANL
jgi:hypothetical protein